MATRHSLILFDELGRGTSTYDGVALAQAIIEYIHNHVHAKTLFSTHYHELTDLANHLPQLQNVHVGAVEKDDQLVFLHKILPGPADKSYGINVAKLAGLPSPLLQRAQVILNQLEQEQPGVAQAADQAPASDQQLPLFEIGDQQVNPAVQQVVQQLKQLDLMAKSPLFVMQQVHEWQQQLQKKDGD